jgi:3-oxoacyl-[acyl-carrier-protein] synthase II
MELNDIDTINAHATSTPRGDVHEANAINKVFGEGNEPPVTAPKSMIGHTLGAAGALEAVLSVQTIVDDTIPPTINHENKDPECDIPVVTETRETPINTVLSNSAGFGGTNGVAVFEEP